MPITDLENKIAETQVTLKRAEELHGPNHVEVAEELMKLAALFRQQNRTLDAANLEARANVIRKSNNVASASQIGVKPKTVRGRDASPKSPSQGTRLPLFDWIDELGRAPKWVWGVVGVCLLAVLHFNAYVLLFFASFFLPHALGLRAQETCKDHVKHEVFKAALGLQVLSFLLRPPRRRRRRRKRLF